jgi:ferredoxin--NADP+ reductase
VAVEGVPFHADTGTIPNEKGRVLTEPDGPKVPHLYVTGWAKRGPTGLIGTNRSCAVETVQLMEEDLDQVGPLRNTETIEELLKSRVRFLSREDWAQLDAWELEEGKKSGTPRRKILSREQAIGILEQL